MDFSVFTNLPVIEPTGIILTSAEYNEKKKRKLDDGELKLVGDKDVEIEVIDPFDISSDALITRKNFIYEEAETMTSSPMKQDLAWENQSKVLDASLWSLNLEEVVIQARRYTAQEKNDIIQEKYRGRRALLFCQHRKIPRR